MDRPLHSGQLSQLSRTTFSLATPADDADIRALLRESPMEGAFRVGFTREPTYFTCPSPAGLEERTLVARRAGRLVSIGAWSEREVWLNGSRATTGYLHGLRMARDAAESMRILREGYGALAECLRDSLAAFWFTSIDAANTRARRVLESRASGLPRYTKLADYRTRVWPVPKRGSREVAGNVASSDELTDFLQRESARHDLALTWDSARWEALARGGFSARDCVAVRRRGRIVAAAGLWDQSAWKQVVVHGYPPWLRRLRPWIGWGARCLGLPGLPAPGGRLLFAPVFPFAVDPEATEALPELRRALENLARTRHIEWLALGLDARDSLWQSGAIGRLGVNYHTILYSVTGKGFPENSFPISNNLFRPDCATL